VLADLSLPDMRGEDLVVRLRKSNPAIAVLLTSGSPSALESLPLLGEAHVASLAKPFTAKMLADAIGAAAGTRESASADLIFQPRGEILAGFQPQAAPLDG
jgi:CheY-like chemotaxis protein